MSSSWDRFKAALAGDLRDNPAAGPLVAADHAAFVSGWPVSHVIRSAKTLAKALGNAHEMYQGDFLLVFSDVYVEAEAMGCKLEFPHDAPPYLTGLRTPESLRSTFPLYDGRLLMMCEAAGYLMIQYGRDVPVFASIKDPFSAAALACGVDDFLMLLVTEPQRAAFAIQVALENQERYLEALIETGANIVIGAPLASGGVVGPRHFDDFVRKPISTLLIQARKSGKLAGVHLCGDADPVLEHLANLPADFVSLESFDAAHWKKLTSDGRSHPVIMGYFPTSLLLQGTRQEIESEVFRERESFAGTPFIISTACDVPQHSPPINVRYFMKAARRLEGQRVRH